jgi:hypothetical protein
MSVSLDFISVLVTSVKSSRDPVLSEKRGVGEAASASRGEASFSVSS